MELLDWQERWLYTPNKNIIWAETGLGKGVLGAYYASIHEVNGVLIVTPSHLIGDWVDKLKGMDVEPHIVLNGKLKPQSVNIVSYAKLTRYKLDKTFVGLILLDESHRIKNYKSKSFKILHKFIQYYSPEVVCLSATIITKSTIDLLPQVYLSNKKIREYEPSYYKFLDTMALFKEMYFGTKMVKTPVSVKSQMLNTIVKTQIFQVTYASERIPKPKYNIKDVIVPIGSVAENIVSEFLSTEKILSNPSFDNTYILNKINNPHSVYLQAVNGFVYKQDTDGKQIVVECGLNDKVETLKSILEYTKPVVLYFFNAEGEVLKGIDGVYEYKSGIKKSIEEQIREFESGEYSMFLANIASIGEGIRFKNTNSIVVFTQQYDYGRILQALGRIMYVGDTKDILQAYLFKTDYKFSIDVERNLNLKKKIIDGLKGV